MLRFLAVAVLVFCSAVAQAGALRVGMSVGYPPLAYKDNGEIVGIEADNVRALSSVLNRPMTIVEMPFSRLIPALKAGEIDVIMSGMSITDERSKEIIFTDPYLEVGQMAIMHRDKLGRYSQPWAIFSEGVRIGVEPDTTGAAFAQKDLKDAQIIYYANPQEAFAGLRADEIDLYVHDAPTSWELAKSSENNDLISLYRPLTEESLAWAVRFDNADLAFDINRALRVRRANGTLGYILNRWIPVTIEVQ